MGLTFFFPAFIPILGALTIPMAVANFLLMGIRFYRLGREWLDRMGLDPAVYVRDRSRSILTGRGELPLVRSMRPGMRCKLPLAGCGCDNWLDWPGLGCDGRSF